MDVDAHPNVDDELRSSKPLEFLGEIIVPLNALQSFVQQLTQGIEIERKSRAKEIHFLLCRMQSILRNTLKVPKILSTMSTIRYSSSVHK